MPPEQLMNHLVFYEPVNSRHITNGIYWGLDGNFESLASSQEPLGQRLTTVSSLSEIGPTIFRDNPDALAQTVARCLNSSNPQIDRLDGRLLQLGKKAHVLLFRALTTEGSAFFVTYLSRATMQDQTGMEAIIDYRNLKDLAHQFDDQVPSGLREKVDVIEPITNGYVKFQDEFLPFFTMPYIPYGELSLRLCDTTPYFGYALHDGEFGEENQRQLGLAAAFAEFKQMTQPSSPDTVTTWTFRQQLMDLLKADCLVYLVSKGRFPAEHKINAGDWMTKICGHEMTLRLITIRGGWGGFENDSGFIERIRTHQEIGFTNKYKGRYLHPFILFSDNQIKEVLNQLRDELDNC